MKCNTKWICSVCKAATACGTACPACGAKSVDTGIPNADQRNVVSFGSAIIRTAILLEQHMEIDNKADKAAPRTKEWTSQQHGGDPAKSFDGVNTFNVNQKQHTCPQTHAAHVADNKSLDSSEDAWDSLGGDN